MLYNKFRILGGKITSRYFSIIGLLALLLAFLLGAGLTKAANFSDESVSITDPTIGETGETYSISVDNQTASIIRCVTVRFTDFLGTNSPITGMSIAGATLDGSSNFVPTPGAWTIAASDATGIITLTNAAGEVPVGGAGRTLIFNSIDNGSVKNVTYYAEINSFSDVGCTTAVDDGVGLFVLTDGVLITSSVVETLNFNLNAAGCSLGQISETQTASCTVGMTASTNRSLGYTISYTGDSTLAESQNLDTISAIGGTAQAPIVGTEQFGFNLVANTTPAVGSNPSGGTGGALGQYAISNFYAYTATGDNLASTAGPSDDTLYIMSFIANADTSTVAGTYNVKQTLTIVPNL